MISKKNTTPVRVCHLIETFYPPFVGGLEIHSYQLAENLNARGLELFVVTRRFGANSKGYERVGSVSVRRIFPEGLLKGKGWKALVPILILTTKVFVLLIIYMNRYDIIFVSSLKVLSVPAIIVKSILRKKCIIIVVSPSELAEDIVSDESLNKMKISRSSILLTLVRAVRNRLLKRTDCFVALSPEIKQQFVDIGVDPKKVRTIPNGIDTNKFVPVSNDEKIRIRKKLAFPENKTIFCFAGRIARAKGVMLLVQVWKEISQKYSNINLVLVGSGKDSYDDCENELRQYIDNYSLKENVFVTGRVDEMNEYLQASDVFVFPSDYEGFGLTILEALACGLPAILTRVGVAPEVIHNYENGIVVNPKNQQELYTAIEWMLEHKDSWEVIGKNARKSIEKYSIEAETDRYLEMFKEISAG